MSKIKRKASSASRKGCIAFRRGSWPIYSSELYKWDVYVESEGQFGPRGLALTKRQAIAMAYSISVSPTPKLVVTYPEVTA
jgi:hypothetical protein